MHETHSNNMLFQQDTF